MRDILEFQVGDVSGERCGFIGHGVASWIVIRLVLMPRLEYGIRAAAARRQHRLRRIGPFAFHCTIFMDAKPVRQQPEPQEEKNGIDGGTAG